MKKQGLNVIAEVAMLSALGYIFDLISKNLWGNIWVNGGGISLMMICIFIIALRHGTIPAVICGLLIGLVNMSTGVYVITGSNGWWNPIIQVALDYWLAHTVVGFGGIFAKYVRKYDGKKKIGFLVLMVFTGSVLKFFCHYLSGLIYWPSTEMNASLYSFLYNGSYMLCSFAVCAIILVVLVKNYESLFITSEIKDSRKEVHKL